MKAGLFVVCLVGVLFAGKVEEEWNKTFNISNEDEAYGSAVDRQGNVYVAGYTADGTYDFRTMKYSHAGVPQWGDTGIVFDGGYDDIGRDVAVRHGYSNYIYVTGYSNNGTDDDFLTIKYTASGDTDWTRSYDNGMDDRANAIVVDDDGYAYVAGTCYDNDSAFILIIKYNQSGDTIWTETYKSSGYDVAQDINLNSAYFYIAGYTYNGADNDFRVMKYDKDGSLQWTRTYDSGKNDEGYGVAADIEGSVYITGRSYEGQEGVFFIVKYTETGDTVWTKVCDNGGDDGGYGAAVNGEYLYVTGYCESSGNKNFMLAKYTPEGDTVWTKFYDSGDDDIAYDVLADDGFLYVVGVYDNGTNTDFRTIKYTEKEIDLVAPNGGEQLVVGSSYQIEWDFTGQIDTVVIELVNESTTGHLDTIAVVMNTNIYNWDVSDLTGYLSRIFVSDASNYSTVRDSSESYFTISETAVTEGAGYPSRVPSLYAHIRSPGLMHIRYAVATTVHTCLKVYAPDGRMARDLTALINGASGQFLWDCCDGKAVKLPAGVYFLRLSGGDDAAVVKTILLR
jgi:uncharacterized delta-60 repeat protein